jgi:predicted DNA-binding protein with PD1-like motif
MERNAELLERSGEFQISRVVIGKLKIGVDLREGIVELVKKEGIKSGVFLSGLGALGKAVFRNAKIMPPNYKMDDKYRIYLEINNPLELVSLPGWIATTKDGEIEVHAHFTASTVIDDKIVTLGGHLTKGTITSIKCVIIIGVMDDPNIFAAQDPAINQTEIYW